MSEADIKYMVEAIMVDLAEFLTSDYDIDIEEALEKIYNSETYSKLKDPSTGLFFQSSGYVYSFLHNELSTGKME